LAVRRTSIAVAGLLIETSFVTYLATAEADFLKYCLKQNQCHQYM
jgi:hypothetical protein